MENGPRSIIMDNACHSVSVTGQELLLFRIVDEWIIDQFHFKSENDFNISTLLPDGASGFRGYTCESLIPADEGI